MDSEKNAMKQQMLRFLAVGSSTVVVDWISYYFLVWSAFNISLAKAGGFVVGTTFAYFANRMWTFQANKTSHSHFIRFIFLYLFTLGLNVATNAGLLFYFRGFEMGIFLSFLGATSVSATLNFLGMKYFVFVPLEFAKKEL